MDLQHEESLFPATTRNEEIQKILSYVRQGMSCQLIALPGVGRGNILGFLAYNRTIRIHHVGEKEQAQFHFVLINFLELKKKPFFDVIKYIFLALITSLHARKKEEEFLVVDKLFQHALPHKDELVLFHELKNAIDFLTLEKGLTLTLLFDRFETYIPQLSEEFFTSLLQMGRQEGNTVSFVFSTTRPLEDSLEPDILGDFSERIADKHIYLPLMDETGLSFRITHLEKLTGKKLSALTKESLITLTGGHEKLMRLSLEGVFSQNRQDESIDAPFLLALRTIRDALTEIWQFFTPDEQHDITTLCKGESCPLPSEFLQKVGLISNGKITIPLLTVFLEKNARLQEKQAHFAFNETTNTIERSGVAISDTLTRSEFRLFRFLLGNQNVILEREAVIHAVWSDTKTQEGVSEQALDQLLFRLRKKIETDPNNPSHLLIIKGRGIKFVQG